MRSNSIEGSLAWSTYHDVWVIRHNPTFFVGIKDVSAISRSVARDGEGGKRAWCKQLSARLEGNHSHLPGGEASNGAGMNGRCTWVRVRNDRAYEKSL
jgi:hypothetical protein